MSKEKKSAYTQTSLAGGIVSENLQQAQKAAMQKKYRMISLALVGVIIVSVLIYLFTCQKCLVFGHRWQPATCTSGQSCTVCAAVDGEALGHNWEAATCTTAKSCTVCAAVDGEALGHSWEAATCTTAKTCTVCDAVEGDALGHNWAEASCTMPKICETCGEESDLALGHTWIEATCTTPKTCEVCGEESDPALGHTWIEATCTTPKTCETCDEESDPALGHTWTAATCTTPKTCEVCGEESGSALGHTWAAATCTTPKTCEVCGKVTGTAKGHQWIEATYFAPRTCSICSATEGEKLKPDPTYINDMAYYSKAGKLWTRSENPVNYPAHPNTNDLSVWEREDIPGHTVGVVLDNQGNRYKYGLHLDSSETKTCYISYNLGGIYTSFTGWCAFPGSPLSAYARYAEKYIEIYADGKLVYITGEMSVNGEPEYIKIDVTNVQILTIQYPASNNPNEAATLFDGLLS